MTDQFLWCIKQAQAASPHLRLCQVRVKSVRFVQLSLFMERWTRLFFWLKQRERWWKYTVNKSIGILITRHLSFHSQMHFSCWFSLCLREFSLLCYVYFLRGVRGLQTTFMIYRVAVKTSWDERKIIVV